LLPDWIKEAGLKDKESRFNEALAFIKEEQYDKAVYLLETLAGEGHAGAQYNLGLCYSFGDGVMQYEAKAAELFLKSAEQGNPDAQFELGICYDFGKGVEKDKSKAAQWYRKAAEQGNEGARKRLDELWG
jgi:TPR repeat protein